MVKDHLDIYSGNPLPPLQGLLFRINSKESFICTMPDRIAHTTGFIKPVMEHWLGREIAQWVDLISVRSTTKLHLTKTNSTHSTHFIYVIWRHTYGKGPFR